MEMNNPECLRCGACCMYVSPNTHKLVRCKYLVILRGQPGKGLCLKHNKRRLLAKVGHLMSIEWMYTVRSKRVFCIPRTMSRYDYPGCPLNTNKPYPPWFTGHGTAEVRHRSEHAQEHYERYLIA
jgi:hypothetical protein